jgi:hypothetical protein
VADVPAGLKWYQSLLGLRGTAPAHPCFGQILDPDGYYVTIKALDAA